MMKIVELAWANGQRQALLHAVEAQQPTPPHFDVYECAATSVLSLVPLGDQVLENGGSLLRLLEGGTQDSRAAPVTERTMAPCDVVNPTVPEAAFCVFAQLVYAPDGRERIWQLLRPMLENTRKEDGNLRYDLYESDGGGAFWMFEAYRDERAIAAHRQSFHYCANVPQIANALAEPIRVHTRIRPAQH